GTSRRGPPAWPQAASRARSPWSSTAHHSTRPAAASHASAATCSRPEATSSAVASATTSCASSAEGSAGWAAPSGPRGSGAPSRVLHTGGSSVWTRADTISPLACLGRVTARLNARTERGACHYRHLPIQRPADGPVPSSASWIAPGGPLGDALLVTLRCLLV